MTLDSVNESSFGIDDKLTGNVMIINTSVTGDDGRCFMATFVHKAG